MRKSLAITFLSAVLFPILVLWPFSIHASNGLYAAIGADLPFSGCVTGISSNLGYNVSKVNQCVSWDTPSSINLVGRLSILLMAILVAVAVSRNVRGKTQARKQLGKINLIVALAVSTATLIAYHFMHNASQAHYVPANLVNDKFIPTHQVAFGYGLTPSVVVILSAIYIVAPLIIWYRVAFSPKYVGGIKKKELFQ